MGLPQIWAQSQVQPSKPGATTTSVGQENHAPYGKRPWEESEEFSKLEKRNNGKCCCWLSIFIQKLFVNTAPAPTVFLPLGITEEL